MPTHMHVDPYMSSHPSTCICILIRIHSCFHRHFIHPCPFQPQSHILSIHVHTTTCTNNIIHVQTNTNLHAQTHIYIL
jgi:hypothetical protein